ncbi:MAG TPA: DEAD/DEAH box helicase family protein [Acholeplasmataceae bacterium]|nr:DEAD/DEAH box helicase family protein [Acholeplasmataceae bacterium]
MNNSIRKSLVDKSVESFTYNPQLVVNKRAKNIKSRIDYYLTRTDRFDIAVSYVVWSGLQLIYDKFKRFDNTSRMILTTEGLVTDPRSLRSLLELGIQVKIYDPFVNSDGFHLKSYFFEKDNDVTLLVGSSNISSRAFGKVHEMVIEVESKQDGQIVEEYQNTFDEIWESNSAIKLTEEFIEGYTIVYNHKIQMDKFFQENNLDDKTIKPNLMQIEALENLEETRLESDRGLIIAATGTGKTYLSAFDAYNSKAKKILFLVHNRLILTDAIRTFKSVFGNSKKTLELKSSNLSDLDSHDIIFTTDKTAYSHLYQKIANNYFDYIIYDEAHKIGEDTQYSKLIEYFKPEFTLGLTATPERTDNPKHLFETFKYSVPYEIRLLDSLEAELICPFTYYGLDLEERLLNDNQKFNYVELAKYLKGVIDSKGHYGDKLKALLFAQNINEAEEIAFELSKLGYNAVSAVSTNSNQELVESYIKSLKSDSDNSIEIIATVNKFNEGVDIPDVNTIIMLRNTESSIIYLQQLGRGLRRTKDPHKFVTVFDIIGNSKNNYSIAEVLTGNETKDKRTLFKHINTNFETVSPFINVTLEKQAVENIINSISNNFKVDTQIKRKFTEELQRYREIPTLKYLYNHKAFNELELLQLLFKDFYTPLQDFYHEKYKTPKNDQFIKNFFRLITQFVFRSYDKVTLSDYIKLLSGEGITNKLLISILMPLDSETPKKTPINSEYFKEKYDNVLPFITDGNTIKLTSEIITKLQEVNAYELYLEHIELFKELLLKPEYKMKDFELIEKPEYLLNVGADDIYMNVVGERIDHNKKTVYCTITITAGDNSYDNYIIDNNKIVYHTQWSRSIVAAETKIKQFVEENYTFHVCAKFPHLGYTNTSYFSLGNVKISEISEMKNDNNQRFNHEIIFELEEEIPAEFLLYRK